MIAQLLEKLARALRIQIARQRVDLGQQLFGRPHAPFRPLDNRLDIAAFLGDLPQLVETFGRGAGGSRRDSPPGGIVRPPKKP